MSLYTSDLVGDMLAEGRYTMFHLQSDEVKVLERMSLRNARRKISLPSPLPGIREIAGTNQQCPSVLRSLNGNSEHQEKVTKFNKGFINEKIEEFIDNVDIECPIEKTHGDTNTCLNTDKNNLWMEVFFGENYDKTKEDNTHIQNSGDLCKDIREEAKRRYSVTDHYHKFPYLDHSKKCLGRSDINKSYVKETHEDLADYENGEDMSDLNDEILLLPSHILGLDSEIVESSLDLVLTVDKSLISGDRQWKVRQASEQARTVWIFEDTCVRNI